MQSILIVDDNEELLNELANSVETPLSAVQIEVRTWQPRASNPRPQESLEDHVDGDTLLVVTDHDLTGSGRSGLFSSLVVDWCQRHAIPVGVYSRGNTHELPSEPNLFELRVPDQLDAAAKFVVEVAIGFRTIRGQLEENWEIWSHKRGPAAVLAALMGQPSLESELGLYGSRLGASNAGLLEKILQTTPEDVLPSARDRRTLLGYIVGHLLLNSVLRFPGPVLTSRALVAYLAISEAETPWAKSTFGEARYDGPFYQLDDYFWLAKIDEQLEGLASQLGVDVEVETPGEANRKVLEAYLGKELQRHDCKRCHGTNGGFWCPFTHRTVCQLAECSVGSTNLIPSGARLCRIERGYYDEWAPILGI